MPNTLTLLRILLAPIFMFFFVIDSFYMKLIGLVLFVVAALTDMADGYFARKYNVTTGFGKFMDPLADKILVSSALISFIALNHVSPLPVILIVGREFAITGVRLVTAYKGVVIPPTFVAKVKTFLQMTVVGVIMGYVTLMAGLRHYHNDMAGMLEFNSYFYFNIALWITAAITLWSGIDYVIKYFHMIKTVLR